MPISTPKAGTTSNAPNFRFSASFDNSIQSTMQEMAAERSKHAKAKTDAGIAQARATAKSIATQVAAWLQDRYAEEGFNIPVRARVNGRFFTIAVTGDAEAQKHARILETGYSAFDLRDRLPTARRKRAIKLTRVRMTKDGPKTYQRGGAEDTPGWYLVVPMVKGRIVQKGGKLTFQRRLTGGMSDDETKFAKDHIEELAAAAAPLDKVRKVDHFDEEEGSSMYRERAGKLGPLLSRGALSSFLPGYRNPRLSASDKATLAAGKPMRNIEIVENGSVMVRKNPDYAQQNKALGRAEKKAADIIDRNASRRFLLSRMGIPDAVIRTHEAAPDWMVEMATTSEEFGERAAGAISRHAQFKGDVVQFRVISSRSKSPAMMAGRPGKHLLAEAQDVMRRELQAEINRESRRAHLTIQQQAYVDMLKTML